MALVGQVLISGPGQAAASSPAHATAGYEMQGYEGVANSVPVASMSTPSVPLSGANAAIPSNPGLLGGEEFLSPTPNNFDFSQSSVPVGAPPNNFDFALAPPVSSTEPTNHNFETGDLSGWVTVGSPTTVADPSGGTAGLLLNSADRLVSSELVVAGSSADLTFDVGYVQTSGYSYLFVYALSGPTFSTVTQLGYASCFSCGTWEQKTFSLSNFADQSIKLEFRAFIGWDVAIDNVAIETVGDIPNWETTGKASYLEENGGSLQLDGSSASAKSDVISVVPGAERIRFDARRNDFAGQLLVDVRHGPNFSESTNVFSENLTNDTFESRTFDVGEWSGQDIQLEFKGAYRKVAIDNVGVQEDSVPGWAADKDPEYIDNGSGGLALRTTGSMISEPYHVPEDAQQLIARMRGSNHPYELIIHSGPNFETETDTTTLQLIATPEWRDVPIPISTFAGETVMLELRRNVGGAGTAYVDLDFLGLPQSALPGWTVSYGGALVGDDSIGGSYVSSDYQKTVLVSDQVTVHPSEVYRLAYSTEVTNGLVLRISWIDDAGQSLPFLAEVTDEPRPLTELSFHLAGKAGTSGRFSVELFADTKLYEFGGNVGAMLAAEPFALDVGSGIDTVSGAVRLTETDIQLEGANPFGFTRYYDSTKVTPSELGFGWTHNFDTRIRRLNNSNHRVVSFGSGKAEAFENRVVSSAWAFVPFDPRVTSTLVQNTDDSFTYTTKNGVRYEFDSDGLLQSIIQRNDRTITLGYTNSQLSTISDEAGRSISFARNAQGQISSATGPDGQAVEYTYSSNNLTSVVSPDSTSRSYAYSPDHLLGSITDAEGNVEISHVYDDFGRLSEQADATGAAITVSHETPGLGATQVTDPDGGVGTFYFDTSFRTTDTVNPAGEHRRYFFDSNGNLDTIVDPAGESWSITYDPDYNVTAVEDPVGNPSSIEYSPDHLPTLVTDALGNTTTFSYDSEGNLLETVGPLGGITTNAYDSAGNAVSTTDALGNITTFTHDAAGNVLSETDPLGRTTTFEYDSLGRRTSTTRPSGSEDSFFRDFDGRIVGIVDADGLGTVYTYYATGRLFKVEDRTLEATTWTYDDRGLPATRTNADGGVESYEHDDDRNLTSVTDPLGRVTAYTYDSAGRVVNRTTPAGAVTAYTYDVAGRLQSITDPLGRVQTRGYDERGNLTVVTHADGTSTSIGYDALDRPTSVTNELGNTSTTTYDALGRITEESDALGRVTSYTYDAVGNLLSVEEPDGAVTTMTYNAARELTSTTDATGATVTQTYNVDGQVESVTSPTGATTDYGYNSVGWHTTTTDPLNRVWTKQFDDIGNLVGGTDPTGSGWSRTFDVMGRQTSETDALGHTSTSSYDLAGQLTAAIDAGGKQTTYTYDTAGRLHTETDPLNGTIVYGYDAAGQLTSLTDANGATRTYAYDLRGRRTQSTDALGRSTQISFDAAGRPTSQVDDRGLVISGSFDAADQLTSRSHSGTTTTFSYDAAGRRTQIVDARGTTSYAYDPLGRLLTKTAPEGSVSYTYDTDGRRSTMTSPNASVSYSYDLAGQLSAIADGNGDATMFAYDNRGLLQTIDRPNGIQTHYTLDAKGQVTQVLHEFSGTTIDDHAYTYDAAGNPVNITKNGDTTTYTVDALDRITTITHPDGTQTDYSYDPAGNRLTETTTAGTVNYSYDAAGQLTDVDGQAYTYDEAGNLVSDGDSTYTWDALNQLTSLATGNNTTGYTYDPFGILVSVDDNGSNTSLLWDSASALPTLLESGATSFLHGPNGVISETTNNNARYLLGDALHSITHVSDSTGQVIGTAQYSAFGQRTTTGIESSFGYTGELQSVDGVYLRARHYNPSTGRFLSTDSVQPNAAGSQGYNLYAYANNNPTRWTDPTGHYAQAAVQVSVIKSLLASPHPWIFLAFLVVALILWLAILCSENPSGSCFNIPTQPNPSNGGPPRPDQRQPDRPPPPIICPSDAICGPDDPTPDLPDPLWVTQWDYLAQFYPGITAEQIEFCHLNWKRNPKACEGLPSELLPLALQRRLRDQGPGRPIVVPPGSTVNGAGEPYPNVVDPRTGRAIATPPSDLSVVDNSKRVVWDSSSDRGAFITEWHERGYARPPGDWGLYDIHHIIPREYGGTNDFENLVPVLREVHQDNFNEWWKGY